MENIQYDESASAEKSWMCIINRDFMESAHAISENGYSVIVKVSYPEEYYYNFMIENTDKGYVIKSFQLDI